HVCLKVLIEMQRARAVPRQLRHDEIAAAIRSSVIGQDRIALRIRGERRAHQNECQQKRRCLEPVQSGTALAVQLLYASMKTAWDLTCSHAETLVFFATHCYGYMGYARLAIDPDGVSGA